MTSSEATLVEFFCEDHRHCDECWTQVEEAVQAGAADGVRSAWETFDRTQRHHLAMEEQVMFPAFEQATGMRGGPTMVMRGEHEQMRGMLDQMAQAFGQGDFEELLDLGDTLLMLIQQHNQKEEGMLYPMADQALDEQWPSIRERLAQL